MWDRYWYNLTMILNSILDWLVSCGIHPHPILYLYKTLFYTSLTISIMEMEKTTLENKTQISWKTNARQFAINLIQEIKDININSKHPPKLHNPWGIIFHCFRSLKVHRILFMIQGFHLRGWDGGGHST